MTRKKMWAAAVMGLSLVAMACLCTSALPGGDGGALGEVVEEVAGPTPLPLTVEYSDEVGGVAMNLPEGWASESIFGFLIAVADPAAMTEGDLNELTSPAIIGFFGAPEDVAEGASSSEEMADQFLSELDVDENEVNVGEPEDITVGGNPAKSIAISGYDPDLNADFEGRAITVLTQQNAGFLFALAPQDQWSDFEPTFEAILATIEFSEPNPEAMFGELDVEIPDATDGGSDSVGGEESVISMGSIAVGEAKSVDLGEAEVHEWTFEGQAGQSVTITVTPGPEALDVTLSLTDPDGAVLAALDDGFSGDPEVISQTLPAAGTYTIAVQSFYPSDSGSYELSIAGG